MAHPRSIAIAQPDLSGNESVYLQRCIESGWVSSNGSFVEQFERDFARFCGVSDAISCSSGTAALHLVLAALGVGPGDEVIVPALTYVATANAVHYCGATPVFADSDPETMNVDPADVARRITARTRAIVPVHLYGRCADIDQLQAITDTASIPIVEDAAQAHGATSEGRLAGSLGAAATFSFFGNKLVTTGEGGMVTLTNPDMADRIRLLRNQGADPDLQYWHSTVGFNYRMTNLQAAVGVAQMERVDDLIASRTRVAGWYQEALAAIEDVSLPTTQPGSRHTHWMYAIALGPGTTTAARDVLIERLAEDGIQSRPAFPPLHLQPPYRDPDSRFPIAEGLSARVISFPTHAHVTKDDVSYIASRLRVHLEASPGS